MPERQPLCPRCQDNLFVRAEQVISGRRVTQAFYCGRCNCEWSIEDPLGDSAERRQGERRKRRSDAIPTIPTRRLKADLRVRRDRRQTN